MIRLQTVGSFTREEWNHLLRKLDRSVLVSRTSGGLSEALPRKAWKENGTIRVLVEIADLDPSGQETRILRKRVRLDALRSLQAPARSKRLLPHGGALIPVHLLRETSERATIVLAHEIELLHAKAQRVVLYEIDPRVLRHTTDEEFASQSAKSRTLPGAARPLTSIVVQAEPGQPDDHLKRIHALWRESAASRLAAGVELGEGGLVPFGVLELSVGH